MAMKFKFGGWTKLWLVNCSVIAQSLQLKQTNVPDKFYTVYVKKLWKILHIKSPVHVVKETQDASK